MLGTGRSVCCQVAVLRGVGVIVFEHRARASRVRGRERAGMGQLHRIYRACGRNRAVAAYGLPVLHSGSVTSLVKKMWMNAAAVSKIFSVVDDLESTHVRGSIACGGWRRSWF